MFPLHILGFLFTIGGTPANGYQGVKLDALFGFFAVLRAASYLDELQAFAQLGSARREKLTQAVNSGPQTISLLLYDFLWWGGLFS